jgi:hypothetical protein
MPSCYLQEEKMTSTSRVTGYAITFVGDNMFKQGFVQPGKRFSSYRTAYKFGVGKWGSGSHDVPGGWAVSRLVRPYKRQPK